MKEQSKQGLGDELANNNVQHEIHFDANDENIEIVTDVAQCNPALTIQQQTPTTSQATPTTTCSTARP